MEIKMEIKIDDLEGHEVLKLLEDHLADMNATSPAESVHALDVSALKDPKVIFWTAWSEGKLMGCAAIKELDGKNAEVKSMRTSPGARNKGIASQLLIHIISVSRDKGYERLNLETGSMEFFRPARSLYLKHGFEYCEPFADYTLDPNSKFMTRDL